MVSVAVVVVVVGLGTVTMIGCVMMIQFVSVVVIPVGRYGFCHQ